MKVTLKGLNWFTKSSGHLMAKLRVKWFFCFGSLLGLIRDDGVVKGDDDIDIGVYYEEVGDIRFTKFFKPYKYFPNKVIRHDKTRRPLYISYKSKEHPTVDIFFWYLHGNIRYHTYDITNKGKEIPDYYVFKGIEKKYLDKIEKQRFGVPGKPLLKRWSPIPAMYGSCLDTWYPDWKTPRKGESKSPFVLEMKSLKGFNDEDKVKKHLKRSKERYEAELSRLK